MNTNPGVSWLRAMLRQTAAGEQGSRTDRTTWQVMMSIDQE